MRTYTKIDTMFKRDTSKEGRNRIIPGDWSRPEFAYLAANEWEFTEKVDGTNIRVSWTGEAALGIGTFEYGGRTENAQIPVVLLTRLDEIFRPVIPEKNPLEEVFGEANAVLYGEGFGPKIQGGAKYTEGSMYQHNFVLFDVEIESQEGWLHLTRPNVEDIAARLGIQVVPIIGRGTLHEAASMAEAGFKSTWNPDLEAEGIVARPATELLTRRGERLITKIKTKDYRDLRRLEGR